MKKILLTLAAAFGLAIAGSGTAWADTETVNGTNFGSATAVTVSTTASGYSASSTSNTKYNSANTIKIKPGAEDGITGYVVTINIKSGYAVSAIEGQVACNSSGTTTTLTSILADGSAVSTFSEITVPEKAATTGTFSVSGLNATESIKLVVADQKELDLGFKITYADAVLVKPTDAIDIKATCVYNTEATPSFVVDADENKFFTSSGAVVTGLTDNGITAVSDAQFRALYNGSGAKISSASSNYQVAFSILPQKGLTFVATSVSFVGVGVGTSGFKVNVSLTNGKATKTVTELAVTNVAQTISTELKGVECTSDNPLSLALQPYNLNDKKTFALSDVVITGYYYGVAEEVKMVNIATSVNPTDAGTIIPSQAGESLPEGMEVSFTAVPATGYKFIGWTDGNSTNFGAANPYSIKSLSSDVTLQAEFEALPSITFTATGVAEGSVLPSIIYGEQGSTTTLPGNQTAYIDGQTFQGWLNGDELLKAGSTFTFAEKTATVLVASYAANEKTFAEAFSQRTTEVKLVWDFGLSKAPTLEYQNALGVYVLPTSVNGVTYDIPLQINTVANAGISGKTGKVYNVGRSDNAQVNEGTILTLPVVKNATIVAVSGGKVWGLEDKTQSTINGSTDYTLSNKNLTATYTYTGDENTVDILVGGDIQYIASITISYPQNAYAVSISDLGAATFSAPIATTIPENVKAYSGALSEDNTTLTLSEVSGIIPANEPVVLFGDKGEYKFTQAAEAGTKVEGNALKAQLTEAVPTAEEGKAICVLNSVEGQLGFYKLNADKKLGANKAYLPVPVATTSTETAETSAPAVRIVFAGENGNVTGIESIAAEKNANAPIFNLAGQKMQGRVAPGLYIQGGKKILVK
jgi:hypothetical protein